MSFDWRKRDISVLKRGQYLLNLLQTTIVLLAGWSMPWTNGGKGGTEELWGMYELCYIVQYYRVEFEKSWIQVFAKWSVGFSKAGLG